MKMHENVDGDSPLYFIFLSV